jgi:hypothetical protein
MLKAIRLLFMTAAAFVVILLVVGLIIGPPTEKTTSQAAVPPESIQDSPSQPPPAPPDDKKMEKFYTNYASKFLKKCNSSECKRLQMEFIADFLLAFSGNVQAMRLVSQHFNDPGDYAVEQTPAFSCLWSVLANTYPDRPIDQDAIRPDDPGCRIILAEPQLTAMEIDQATGYRKLIDGAPMTPLPQLLEFRGAALGQH